MAAAGQFSAVDYVVFALMLLISAVIGIYYGFFGSKQKTTKEYLLADRSMPSWPVAVSLLASYLSAITLLGAPSEVYTYGSQYMVLVFFSYWVFCFAVAVVFIPVFYRTHIVSVNEVTVDCTVSPMFSTPQRIALKTTKLQFSLRVSSTEKQTALHKLQRTTAVLNSFQNCFNRFARQGTKSSLKNQIILLKLFRMRFRWFSRTTAVFNSFQNYFKVHSKAPS